MKQIDTIVHTFKLLFPTKNGNKTGTLGTVMKYLSNEITPLRL